MPMLKKIILSSRGQALIELSLTLPLLLVLSLGAIEIGNVIYAYQVLTHLTREGANMASRLSPPTTPSDVLTAIIDAACPVISDGPPPSTCPPSNDTKWRVIYTGMGPDSSAPDPKPYVVLEQLVRGSGGVTSSKRICDACGLASTYSCDPALTTCNTPNVPNISTIGSGQTLYAVEGFYDYSPITPLGNFLGFSFADKFYERAIF